MSDPTLTNTQIRLDFGKAHDPVFRSELTRHSAERLRQLGSKMASGQDCKDDEGFGRLLGPKQSRISQMINAQPFGPVLPLLRAIAAAIRHELIDLARQFDRPIEVEPASSSWDDSSPTRIQSTLGAPDPANRVLDWSKFHRAVESLSDTDREVFDLIWYHGLEQVEAATLLDLPLPTLKRNWMAARVRLQDGLSGKLPECH